ncbi:hypothetical protein [Nannocystis pusilla]|uniref:hypothetical protein n=1 Tax=Nannocystis pusilla TaxID=889268 RepID=UPI003B789869
MVAGLAAEAVVAGGEGRVDVGDHRVSGALPARGLGPLGEAAQGAVPHAVGLVPGGVLVLGAGLDGREVGPQLEHQAGVQVALGERGAGAVGVGQGGRDGAVVVALVGGVERLHVDLEGVGVGGGGGGGVGVGRRGEEGRGPRHGVLAGLAGVVAEGVRVQVAAGLTGGPGGRLVLGGRGTRRLRAVGALGRGPVSGRPGGRGVGGAVRLRFVAGTGGETEREGE